MNDDFLEPPRGIFWKIRHLFAMMIPVVLIFFLAWLLIRIYRSSDVVILSWEENKKLFYYNLGATFTSDDDHEQAVRNQYALENPFSFERRNKERADDLEIINIGLKMYQHKFTKLPITEEPEPIKNGSRIHRELKMVLSHVPTDPLPNGENSDYQFDCRDGFRYTVIMYFEEMGGDVQPKRSKREYSNN